MQALCAPLGTQQMHRRYRCCWPCFARGQKLLEQSKRFSWFLKIAYNRDQHWREIAAAREKGTCLYHETYPEADAEAPAREDNPIMAEVEPGHLVTCAHVDEEGGCGRSKARRAA